MADVKLAKRLITIALGVYPKLKQLADPLGTLRSVERQTLTEMNFHAEETGAAWLADLAEFASIQLPHLRRLRFPRYFPGLSGEGFLVSEFVEGRTIAEWLERGQLPYEALLELFRIQGFFLFVQGQFHGDLHPGNIIWRDGNLWFLDNANIEIVPTEFASGLLAMLVHIGNNDLGRAGNQLADLSMVPLASRSRRNFLSSFNALYRDFAGRTVSEKSLTRQMMETVKLSVRHGIKFPSGAFPLIKSLMYLDGMVLRCNPRAVLLRDVAKFAEDFPATPRPGVLNPVLN